MVNEILQEMNKYFNNDTIFDANQQLIGHRDLFRGVVVKELVVSNKKNIDLRSTNKEIEKMSVKYDHECWKRRCVVLRDLEVQRKVLPEIVETTKEKDNKGSVKGLKRCAEVHSTNEDETLK